MALDGVFLRHLKEEIGTSLLGTRVDRVFQPNRDELILAFRGFSAAYKLLISARANSARVNLTTIPVENPQQPPMLCMLLRKKLQGAKLLEITQPDLERALMLKFDSVNELGDHVELTYIDSVFESLALAENERDLNEIRAELAEQGYVRRKAGKKNQKQPALSAPLKFKTSDGFTVLVGRNNRQNDKLTMKDANNNDIWFHTKNIPGSHTVLVTDGKAPTETAMEEAAVLAAQHSRAKDSAQVPVDYTQIRYVSKPQGAKPGMVIYVQYKTVYVDPTTESKAKQQS